HFYFFVTCSNLYIMEFGICSIQLCFSALIFRKGFIIILWRKQAVAVHISSPVVGFLRILELLLKPFLFGSQLSHLVGGSTVSCHLKLCFGCGSRTLCLCEFCRNFRYIKFCKRITGFYSLPFFHINFQDSAGYFW